MLFPKTEKPTKADIQNEIDRLLAEIEHVRIIQRDQENRHGFSEAWTTRKVQSLALRRGKLKMSLKQKPAIKTLETFTVDGNKYAARKRLSGRPISRPYMVHRVYPCGSFEHGRYFKDPQALADCIAKLKRSA